MIKGTIAYKSEDNSLIAINKPFGVGTYSVLDSNTRKQNQDKFLYQLQGSPRYCIADVLKPLADEFKSKEPYETIKGIDRYLSGLILISNKHEEHRKDFLRSLGSSRVSKLPPYGFRAITYGVPTIRTDRIYEKVGIELTEVDELGDHSEPMIVEISPTFKHHKKPQRLRSFQAELIVKETNREYSTALLELFVSKLLWDFPRCYIASKTSFILGDVRFSKRIGKVLGKQVQISPLKSSGRYEKGVEPLDEKLKKILGVHKNCQIPLMLDLYKLRLKDFHKKSKHEANRDLIIESPYTPLHFAATAEILKLVDDSDIKIYQE